MYENGQKGISRRSRFKILTVREVRVSKMWNYYMPVIIVIFSTPFTTFAQNPLRATRIFHVARCHTVATASSIALSFFRSEQWHPVGRNPQLDKYTAWRYLRHRARLSNVLCRLEHKCSFPSYQRSHFDPSYVIGLIFWGSTSRQTK